MKNIPAAICIILLLVHVVALIIGLYQIFFGTEMDWPVYWLLFLLLDFPYSFIGFGVQFLLASVSIKLHLFSGTFERANDFHNFMLPFLIYGVGGTFWWIWVVKKALKTRSEK